MTSTTMISCIHPKVWTVACRRLLRERLMRSAESLSSCEGRRRHSGRSGHLKHCATHNSRLQPWNVGKNLLPACFRVERSFTTTTNHRRDERREEEYADAEASTDDKLCGPDDADDPHHLSSNQLFADTYLQPIHGHRVIIIHPEVKRSSQHQSPTHHQLSESCALVDALPGWSVLTKETFPLKQLHSQTVFTRGVYARVCDSVRGERHKTAVFVDVGMLSGLQLATLQRDWGVPVYDRYTLVLQIFRQRARTKEAKLQVALAEIPYYRSRLRGMHEGALAQQRGGLEYLGGADTWKDRRYQIIADKERSLRASLAQLARTRDTQRTERRRRQVPTVAVVGYTNAGKTSLIKALTRSAALAPWDQLFATLDVTCHGGHLGNNMRVVYMDTVGFISNIPTSLIAAFRATLDDIATTDLVVHVRDISHPDTEAQRDTVVHTLGQMGLGGALLDNMLEVHNKCDLIDNRPVQSVGEPLYTSTRTGEGLGALVHALEHTIIAQTDREERRLKIPAAGRHLSWLYREATVTHTRPCGADPESILVTAVMTTAAYQRFRAAFGKKKKAAQR